MKAGPDYVRAHYSLSRSVAYRKCGMHLEADQEARQLMEDIGASHLLADELQSRSVFLRPEGDIPPL